MLPYEFSVEGSSKKITSLSKGNQIKGFIINKAL